MKKTEKDGKKRFRLVYSQNSQKLPKVGKKYITIMPMICLYNLYTYNTQAQEGLEKLKNKSSDKFRQQVQQPKIDKSVETLRSVKKFDKCRKMGRNIWGKNNGEKLV